MIVNPNRVGVLEPRHQVRPRKFRRNPISDDDQIASFWDRASALLVDAIVGASVWFVLVFVLAVATSADWQLAMVISIIFVPVYALAVSLLVAIRGQSPGKMLGGLKIMRADGHARRWNGYWFRQGYIARVDREVDFCVASGGAARLSMGSVRQQEPRLARQDCGHEGYTSSVVADAVRCHVGSGRTDLRVGGGSTGLTTGRSERPSGGDRKFA